MNKICNYPNQDDYETEEEYNEALEWYWMEIDRQYDEWKDDQLTKDKQWKLFGLVFYCLQDGIQHHF